MSFQLFIINDDIKNVAVQKSARRPFETMGIISRKEERPNCETLHDKQICEINQDSTIF